MPTVRRTRAGADRRRMARQLADRHTAHSQRYTSCRPPTPTHNIYNPPSAARRRAGYCRRRYCSSSEAALRGARASYQTRAMGSGAAPCSPYAALPIHFFTPSYVGLSQILGARKLLDAHALGAFLAQCQFKFGVIGKAPGEYPDKSSFISSVRPLTYGDAKIHITHI